MSELLSPHVSVAETLCRCGCGGGADKIDHDLLDLFERIREKAGGKPLSILSAYRCAAHNKAVGGAPRSQHKAGRAFDIVAKHIGVGALYHICDELNPDGGVGRYATFVHIDVRGSRARWSKGLKE